MSLEYQIGQVVYSKSGHDQGDVQMICAIEGGIPSSCRRQTQEAGKAQTQKEEACSAYFLCRKDVAAKLQTGGISSGCRYQEGIEKVPAGTRCLMFKEVYGLV